ncbi:MAG: FtsX-like permease family protein [Bacteroidota bacterium]
MYQYEKQTGQVFLVFANLAVFIACLGLFGLSTFIASQKIKEIGIRKVLGASETSIVLLLSKSFAKLVLISCLIGLPVAYLTMEQWLENFAYRTTLKTSLFVLAGTISLFIAAATIGIQAWRASKLNPATSLKQD